MVQPAALGPGAAAAAHQEQARRRLGLDAVVAILQPAVEPAPAKTRPGRGQVAGDGRRRAEIGIAGEGRLPVAVQPRAHDHLQRPCPARLETRVIGEGRVGVDVVPARHEDDRDRRDLVVKTLGIEADLAPGRIEGAGAPLLEQIGLVFRVGPHRGAPFRPRHRREPGADILRLERGAQDRVALRFRALLGVVEGPGRLLQLEGAALPDALAIGVGEAAGIDHHRGEARRGEAGERHLRMRGVGQAHRADAAVAPRLIDDPGAGVVAVLAFGQVFRERALRAVAAAAILEHDDVAGAHEGQGELGPRHGLGVARLDLRARAFPLAVGRALQDDRQRPIVDDAARGGAIDVGGEADAVAHARPSCRDAPRHRRRTPARPGERRSASAASPPPFSAPRRRHSWLESPRRDWPCR